MLDCVNSVGQIFTRKKMKILSRQFTFHPHCKYNPPLNVGYATDEQRPISDIIDNATSETTSLKSTSYLR